jgi:hypothetical protein
MFSINHATRELAFELLQHAGKRRNNQEDLTTKGYTVMTLQV